MTTRIPALAPCWPPRATGAGRPATGWTSPVISMQQTKSVKQHSLLLFVATATSLLVACGGGSSSGADKATDTPNTGLSAGTGTTTAIVTAAVPVPNYAAASQELVAYNTFNTARVGCGFGFLQQNTLIDKAAFNHAVWLLKNNTVGHYQTPATVAFTGIGPGDRMLAAGYNNGIAGEVIAAIPSINSGYGLDGARGLLSAPYHLAGLMFGFREIGISVKTGGPIGSGADIEFAGASNFTHLVADMGASSTYPKQYQASADVLTYPCAGVVNTATALYGEIPNPIPARNLATSPIGQPVFVQVLQGNLLVITSSSIIKTVDSSPVPIAVTLTSANDPNAHVTANQAIIIPNAPLSPMTQYTVTIQGTNNGALFLKNFTFTTGACLTLCTQLTN